MQDTSAPVLSEHQAPDPNPTSPGGSYAPTPEEKQTIKLVMKIFEKSKKWRAKYDHKWLDNYRFFRGKQWKEARPSYKHSEVINMVFQSIQSTVPIMTDARPRIEFLPRDPGDLELAEILNDVLECDWDRQNWDEVLVENILEAHLYSVGLGYVGYDPKANYGEGAIQLLSADPFYNYPDPNCRDVNLKSRHWVEAEPIDVDVLKVEYPDKAQWIKPDLEDFIRNSKTEMEEVMYKSPVDNKTMVEGEDRPETGGNKVLKITCWMKSDEIIEEKKSKGVNPDSGLEEFFYEQKLKYPHGRKVCVASGVLLDDVPNFEDGMFPLARLVNYVLPREFYGISEVEQLESPQKIFNKLVSFALDVMTMMGNPIWIVGTDADVDTDNLFNRPGLVLETADINKVRREEGVQLQPYVLQLIDRMREWFDGVSGSQDVSRGANPTGVTAASAITTLQEAAQTRIRLKVRNLDQYLRQIGTLWLNRAFQFYSAPRVIRVSNNPNAQKYFKFHVDTSQVDEQGSPQKYAVVTPMVQDPVTGQPVEQESKRMLIQGEFDVKVSTGSGLPFAKAQKLNIALQLFDRQAIDQLELLKAADYPNAEAVYERVQARQQQEAMAQMAAQGGGQGVPGGPPPAGPPQAPPPQAA